MKRMNWTEEKLQGLPKTREEAHSIGSKHFFLGTPCRKGHIAAIRTSNNRCLECMREETRNSAERRRRRRGQKLQVLIEPLVEGIRQHRLTATGGFERRRVDGLRRVYIKVFHEVRCDCGRVFWLNSIRWGKQRQCKHCDSKVKSKKAQVERQKTSFLKNGRSMTIEGQLVYSARRRSSKLGLPFDLEPDDINIPNYCPVLGIAIDKSMRRSHDHSPRFNAPSIDRNIPARGYIKENIRVISMRANNLKKDGTVKEHIMVAEFMERMGVKD